MRFIKEAQHVFKDYQDMSHGTGDFKMPAPVLPAQKTRVQVDIDFDHYL